MKNLFTILIFCLPILAIAQSSQRYSGKEKTVHLQKNEYKVSFSEKMNQLKGKFQVPADLKVSQKFSGDEILKSEDFKFSRNRELRMNLKERILKSAQTDTLLTDSIYGYTYTSATDSFLFVKIYTDYNEKGDMWCFRQCEWDSVTNAWLNTYREDSFSDQNGKDTLIVIYEWSSGIDDWQPQEKIVYHYDEQGKPVIYARYEWHHSQQWRGSSKYEYEYDEWGNQTKMVVYIGWNDVTKSWIGSYKYESKFDAQGNELLNAYYYWNAASSDWIGNNKTENIYDNPEFKRIIVSYFWDTEKGDWEYLRKEELWYDESWTHFLNSSYFWDGFYEKWIGENKFENIATSDTTGTEFYYTWNFEDEMWEQASKTEHQWNQNGTYNKWANYTRTDTIIPIELINGFNSDTTISKIWITPACPDQTCTALDSDYVEGNASVLWNFNINGNFYSSGGFCQIDVKNDMDLSGTPAIAFNCKVLLPSDALFIIRFKETSGEIWVYESYQPLSDSTGNWELIYIPLAEVYYPVIYVDGYFDTGSIEQIQIRLHVPNGVKTSGTLLIDNLCACSIKKTGSWQPVSMGEEYYDGYGNYLGMNSYRWDETLIQFVLDYKYKSETEYDEFGNLLNRNSYVWYEYNDEWKWISRYENEYDENGRLLRTESYNWEDFAGGWVGSLKEETTYDENGNLLTQIYYMWNLNTATWLPDSKMEKSWNTSGNLIAEAYYYWNTEIDDWIGNWKQESYMNEQNELYKTIYYDWDFEAGKWIISTTYSISHFENIFDGNGNLLATARTCWDENSNCWSPVEKYYYFNSLHSITEADLVLQNTNEKVLIYPNPASDFVHVKITSSSFSGTYSLFNSNGTLLKKSILTGILSSLPVYDLPKGNYILHIETEKFVESKKIIVQ